MTDYKKRIDGIFEDLIVGHNFEYVAKEIEALLYQVEAETDRNSRIDELTALPFTEREISCMDCLATHIVKDRLATLKKGDLHE